MKSWVRHFLISVVALTVLTVGGLAAFLWSFDPNSYKSALQVMVQQRMDRQLTINGDLKVVFFPDIAIQARQVSLSEQGSEQVFASVDDLRATIAIWPLLKNHLVIEEVSLSGLKAQVKRSGVGVFVLDDLLRWGRKDSAVSNSGDPGLSMDDTSVDIAEISVKKSEFTVLDIDGNPAIRLYDISLELGRLRRGEPFSAELTARIQFAQDSAVARFGVQAVMDIDIASRRVSAKNLNASLKGDLPPNAWLDDSLKKVDFSVISPALVVEPDTGRLKLERLALRAKGMRGRAPFEFSLDAPMLDISDASARGDSVTSRLRLDGSPAIDARISLDGLKGTSHKLEFERSMLDIAIKRDARVSKLTLNTPIILEPFVSGLSLTAVQGELQIMQAPVSKTLQTLPIQGVFSLSYDHNRARPRPLGVEVHAENLPFATLLTAVGIESLLDGNATLDFKARLSPGTFEQMQQSLEGQARINLRQAWLHGIDLALGFDALRQIVATDSPALSLDHASARRTPFDRVEVDLKLGSGIANITRLNMTAPGWTIRQGSPAKINFQQGTLDIVAWLQMLGPQSLTVRNVTILVRSLLVPLQLRGPVSRPDVGIQWSALERDPMGRALKDKLLNAPAESGAAEGSAIKGAKKK